MRKSCVQRALLMLVCMNVLALTAHSQPRSELPLPGDQRQRRQPSYLYPVSTRDKTTGEKRVGFINQTGKLVIGFDRLPKRIEGAFEFQDGRAAIYVTKEKVDPRSLSYTMGYIDETGKVVIAPRYDEARDFSEGLAYVSSKEFRGFIDRHGKAVIKLDDEARDFHEGLAAVKGSGTSGWGYVDRSGRWVIKPQYQLADDFSEGLAQVMVDVKFGFVNRRGEMVIPPRFDAHPVGYVQQRKFDTSRFAEGLACVSVGDLYGYINKKGDFVIPPQFSHAQEFSEGLAWVVTRDAKTYVQNRAGWIDKTGQWVVTGVNGRTISSALPEFISYQNYAMDWRYSEGLVPFIVYEGDESSWGYMDRKGKVMIKPILVYYEAYGVTDREGTRVVTEPRGHTVGPFLGGVARVDFEPLGLEKAYGYINKMGQFIWQSW